MTRLLLTNFMVLFLLGSIARTQEVDSALENLQKIPAKYKTGN